MDRRNLLKSIVASSMTGGFASGAHAQNCGTRCFSMASVVDYGARGDGVNDDLHAFKAAHDALGERGGILTGPQLTYRLGGTLTISNPVTIDFFNTIVTHYPGHGALLVSKVNGPILEYTGTWTRFVGLRNINIVGAADGSAPEQDGVVVANGAFRPRLVAGGIRMQNVGVFDCGRYGIRIKNSYASSYENLYVQNCGHSGVLIDTHCGANRWASVNALACKSTGFNVAAADGSDIVIALVVEQNRYGIVLDAGVKGWEFIGTHSEANSVTPLLFKEKSDNNRVDFKSRGGGAEPEPINRGGPRNTFSGGR